MCSDCVGNVRVIRMVLTRLFWVGFLPLMVGVTVLSLVASSSLAVVGVVVPVVPRLVLPLVVFVIVPFP